MWSLSLKSYPIVTYNMIDWEETPSKREKIPTVTTQSRNKKKFWVHIYFILSKGNNIANSCLLRKMSQPTKHVYSRWSGQTNYDYLSLSWLMCVTDVMTAVQLFSNNIVFICRKMKYILQGDALKAISLECSKKRRPIK